VTFKSFCALFLMVLIVAGFSSSSNVSAQSSMPNSTAGQALKWRVCELSPWVEADAKELPGRLKKRTNKVELSGPVNDWLTGAVGVATDEKCDVTVSLAASEPIKGRIQLRVVGQIPDGPDRRVVWDPLFTEKQVNEYAGKVVNGELIKNFPKLTVTPEVPAFLWLTVNLKGVKPGEYRAELTFKDEAENVEKLPLVIKVLAAELPVDNPLCCLAWQHTSDDPDMIRDKIDHGINVFWRNHEAAWKNGAKFLLIQFSSSFNRQPITDEKKLEVKAELEKIWQLMDRLKVPRENWALNTADEISDSSAQIDLAYAKLIKSIRPDTPLCFNPAWGKAADSNQNNTTLDGAIKVIAPVTDIWLPYCWHLWDGSGAMDYMRSTGKPLWTYEINGCAARNPSVARSMFRKGPYMAWKYRLTGFSFYALNAYHGDNPWNHDKSENYALVYTNGSGPDGVVASRGYEVFRQAIQEYKRLYVLKQLGVPENVLDSWVNRLLGEKATTDDFDRLRVKMDAQLVKIRGKSANISSDPANK
jgi:hypothetical protein